MQERNAQLHYGHRKRVKKQIITSGLESKNEHEVLEAFLFQVIRRGDTNELAHKIANETGGTFADAVDAGYDRLIKIDGVGESVAYYFDFFRQASSLYLSDSYKRQNSDHMEDSNDLCEYFRRVYLGIKNEELYAVGFDNEKHIVCKKMLAVGDPSCVAYSLRKIDDFVIKMDLSRIAIAHNHRNGSFLPSQHDIEYTAMIVRHLSEMNTELVDHVIVGSSGAFSLRSSIYASEIWK